MSWFALSNNNLEYFEICLIYCLLLLKMDFYADNQKILHQKVISERFSEKLKNIFPKHQILSHSYRLNHNLIIKSLK